MSKQPQQLVFELPHRPALGLEDFLVSSSNGAAVALIDRWPDWPAGAAMLAGDKGSGKSHLANVWRLKSGAVLARARDLTVGTVPQLAAAGAVVVEDVDSLKDEQALFHLLNLVREQRVAALLTSAHEPGVLSVRLPDLASRLKALPLAIIAPPDDALLRAVLVKLFADRQLSVEPALIDYVLVRMDRAMASAQAVVSEIDRLGLARQRAVTRALAAEALENLGYGAPPA